MPTAATESIVGVWEAQPSSQSIMPSSAVGTAALTDQMHSSTSGMEWDALMAHRRECADSMIHNAKLMYPNPLCTCPVGQMPASLGRCQDELISKYRESGDPQAPLKLG
ncbi:unnamed protein product [Toxocara canis]|uniref:Uncharacterized protein n=1 Tax=Toxocara canis TaxID=6265 RepID=A0A183ULV9_TOXCA|nr:unnamed protein product [Toxocara canis]